jgi:Secretion system C-terminal sorting domain
MYIFTANIGDEWPAFDITDTCCNCTNVNLKVYNKGDTLIQGQTLRWIDLGPADSSVAGFALSTYMNRVIEGIGNTGGFLIPSRSNICYPTDTTIIVEQTYSEFRCFYSPTLSLNRFADCDGILAVGEAAADNNRFTIFPNPTNEITNIQPLNTNLPYSITVYNSAGKTIQNQSNVHGQFTLTTNNMPAGLYLVSLQQGGTKYAKRLVVNN